MNEPKKHSEEINLRLPAGCRQKIKECADSRCMTVQRFIREAINTYAGKQLITKKTV